MLVVLLAALPLLIAPLPTQTVDAIAVPWKRPISKACVYVYVHSV
jgi:hypothetical protein